MAEERGLAQWIVVGRNDGMFRRWRRIGESFRLCRRVPSIAWQVGQFGASKHRVIFSDEKVIGRSLVGANFPNSMISAF